jgi:hypothetical protein
MPDKLEDVLTIDAGIRGPADIAVRLARAVKRKRNPVVDVLVVVRTADGKPGATWSNTPTNELAELVEFIGLVLEDQRRAEWTGELDDGEYDAED